MVNEAYFAIDTNAVQAIKTSAGQATLDEDGKTIFWDLSGTDPYTTYTMTIELELKKLQGTDEYPTGKLPTNEGTLRWARTALCREPPSTRSNPRCSAAALLKSDRPTSLFIWAAAVIRGP